MSRASNSSNVIAISPTFTEAASFNKAGTSSRKASRQDGSRPTIGIPASAKGKNVVTKRRASVRARSTMPVDKNVRPQHNGRFDWMEMGEKIS